MADDTQYVYRVTPYDREDTVMPGVGGGGRRQSDGFGPSQTTPAVRTPPAVPASLSAAAPEGGGVDLAWADRSDNESGFRVTRTNLTDNSARVFEVAADAGQFRDEDTDLTAGVRYRYEVAAFNAAGASAASEGYVTPLPFPAVSIVAIDPSAGESAPDGNANPGRFLVTRTGATGRSLTVTVAANSFTTTYFPPTTFIQPGVLPPRTFPSF